MRLLLDTHAFLWFVSGDRRLPGPTRDLIRSADHDVWLSVVSIWEAVVKQQIGRLELPASAWSYLRRQRDRHDVDSLPLHEAAVEHLGKLPAMHRDPFDRMLICQAIEHELQLVTDDEAVRQYPVKTVWLDG
jgi:PIN domain nuclease of toxin-antitoxin system